MAPVDDFGGFKRKLQAQLELLESAPIDERDRAAATEWIARKQANCTASTTAGYAKRIRLAAKHTQTPLVEMEESDFFRLRNRLATDPALNPNSEGPLSEATVFNYMVVVRMFLQDQGREWADEIKLSEPDVNTVDPKDMLDQDDIAALRDAATRNRDIAMIEFLSDTGVRLSLMGSLRVCDVDLDSDTPTYRPNANATGLKGAEIQRYPIIDSKGALRNYLRHTHPHPDKPKRALFHKIERPSTDADDDGAISPKRVRDILREAADAAGVDKPVNPHNFRHSAVTRMIREGYTRTEIEHRVHWALDSDMWDTYVHVEGEKLTEDVFERAGIIAEDDESASPRREQCPNCREPLPDYGEYCPTCQEPITREAREAQADLEDAGIELLASEKLAPEDRRIVETALRLVRHGEARPDHAESS